MWVDPDEFNDLLRGLWSMADELDGVSDEMTYYEIGRSERMDNILRMAEKIKKDAEQ